MKSEEERDCARYQMLSLDKQEAARLSRMFETPKQISFLKICLVHKFTVLGSQRVSMQPRQGLRCFVATNSYCLSLKGITIRLRNDHVCFAHITEAYRQQACWSGYGNMARAKNLTVL